MLNLGDFIEVVDRGHVGRIIDVDLNNDKIWIEWQHSLGNSYDYKFTEGSRHWQETTKAFSGLCPVGKRSSGSVSISLNKNSGLPTGMIANFSQKQIFKVSEMNSEALLQKFENLLNDTCQHEYQSYTGLNEKYDFCKKCPKTMPFQHLTIKVK